MNNENLSMLDILNIISFVIGIMNYDENLSQSDKQDLMSALNEQTNLLLDGIHKHLKEQDKKLDTILEVLNNDKNKEIG